MFSKIRNILRNVYHCQSGNIVLMTAALLPAIVGGVGLAVDYAAMSRHSSNLQDAVDAAALRAAKELAISTGDQSYVSELAKTFVKSNLKSYPVANISVVSTMLAEQKGVKVDVSYTWEPIFAKYFNASVTPVKATATASLAGSGSGLTCLIGLMPRKDRTAIHGDNDSILNAGDCFIQSNSPGYSIRVDQNAQMFGKKICAAGSIFKYGFRSKFVPEPITDCPSMGDPLADRPQPSVGGCDYTNMHVGPKPAVAMAIKSQEVDEVDEKDSDIGDAIDSPDENDQVGGDAEKYSDVELSPGVYCGGLTISGDAEVKLKPGIYIIKDGPFIVADQAKITGWGVGFFLTGEGSLIEFQADTSIDLVAPRTGALAGLLFFEDRNVPHSFIFDWRKILPLPPDVRLHRISSNNARRLHGTVYLSKSIFLVDADATVADQSAYTAIIAARVWLQKGPVLTLNANYKDSNVPVPPGLLGTTIRLAK